MSNSMLSFKKLSTEDRKMLNSIFWRSLMVFAGPCGAAYRQAPGFTNSIMPALVRYYPEKEKLAEAMVRHMTPYNITQNVGTFAMGLVASMEKENAENYGEYDPSAIVSIKTALMGPMSGIGDSIYWGIVRSIAAAVGIGAAAGGSILGPILFLLIYNIPGMLGRYYLTYLGYTMGESFISQAFKSGLIQILIKCAGIIGMMMVGYMVATTVTFNIALSIPMQDAEPVLIQTYLDQLLVGVLPLSLSFVCYYALKKNVNLNALIFIVMGIGFVLGFVGIC